MKQHPTDCRMLKPNCLYMVKYKNHKGKSEIFINCTFLNSYLEIIYSHLRKSHTSQTIVKITPHWECPFWQEGRKKGLYPKIQASIYQKSKHEKDYDYYNNVVDTPEFNL